MDLFSGGRSVRRSHAYITVVSHRYGDVPGPEHENPRGHSATRIEFEEAQERKLPTVVFVMGEKHPGTRADFESDPSKLGKLEEFRERAKSGRLYATFDSLEEFRVKAAQVASRLRRFLEERNRTPEEQPATLSAPIQRISPTRLPLPAEKLFGRDRELAALDTAWNDRGTRIVTLVAWGGVGKSALVAEWVARLSKRNHDGADYFDWSFYSQGTRGQGGASADLFVDSALRFFGDEKMADSPSGPWDKGARLARLVAERPTLLVLDGLEPLQHPPGPLAGELKDPAVSALLKGLAARNPALCVVTTRESVADLRGFHGSTAPEWKLEHLSTEAGLALLESLKVHGDGKELERLVADVKGHALTLNLLGRFLRDAHGGDVRRRDVVHLQEADDEVQGGHAFRVMAAYERWFEGQGEAGTRSLAVLRLLGLFDRPAGAELLAALRKPPAIPGLTEAIVEMGDAKWSLAVSRLAACGLVAADEEGGLDAHPLVREHFARRLREGSPEAWKAAHGRLYEHLCASAEERPDTLPGLQPLYQAVVHGCLAGRQQETCDNVYFGRICQGQEALSTKQLGAYGADLAAVACFFESPWRRVSSALADADKSWLLSQAAFRLRALGRLSEAVEPMRAGLQMHADGADWRNAAVAASNLSELELALGDVAGAHREAKRSVDFADLSGDAFQRLSLRTTLADARHQAGWGNEALTLFREAEAMQAEEFPQYPLLTSLSGFRYCDLLLGMAERAAGGGPGGRDAADTCWEIERRVAQTLPVAVENGWLLDIALGHLSLSRAGLYRAILEGVSPDDAKDEIEQAVAGLRRAGIADFVLRGLLTRAWLRFLLGDAAGARADLDEAEEIAQRGPMPLFLADIRIHRARLFHDRAALTEARRLVEKHGYGRRLPELDDLDEMAKGWGADTVAAS